MVKNHFTLANFLKYKNSQDTYFAFQPQTHLIFGFGLTRYLTTCHLALDNINIFYGQYVTPHKYVERVVQGIINTFNTL